MDPDICDYYISRDKNWRGAFGQVDAAQKVLENNNIKERDLFIFFGWFNNVEFKGNKYTFRKDNDRHCMFGYLQIDKIINPKYV